MDMIVYNAAKGITSAIAEMLTDYTVGNASWREKRIAVQMSVEAFQGIARSHVIGEVIRQNIIEIVQTQRLIDSLKTSGDSLDYCMHQLEELSMALDEHLNRFKRNLR